MLAMADRCGLVAASSDGIARRANVTEEQCEGALAVLEAQDPKSKSKAHRGRRIRRVDGGWLILNYLRYRELRTAAQVAEAERKANYRKSKRLNVNDSGHVPGVPGSPNASGAEAKAKGRSRKSEKRDAGASAPRAELPPAAVQLLQCVALTKQAAVEVEMRQLLNGGLPRAGGVIRADSSRLESKCAETLARTQVTMVRNLWAYTLQKLGDVSDDSPTERAAATEARARDADSEMGRDRYAKALAWVESEPAVLAAIRAKMQGAPELTFAVQFNSSALEAWMEAGEPTIQFSAGLTS